MTHNTIKVSKITKSFGQRQILKNISIEISSGEIVGLLGPNGSGKTTAFQIICGIQSLKTGDIYLNDKAITHLPLYEKAKIGIVYLPQEPSIFRGLNVEKNIWLVLELQKNLSKHEKHEKLESLLEEFGLEHLRKSSSISLSGGERRRLEIARSLACNPKFILLDEPLAGIDPITMEEISSVISKLKKKNVGILITEHNVYETLKIVDRAYVIYDGKVLTHGTAKKIISDPLVKKYYLGNYSTN